MCETIYDIYYITQYMYYVWKISKRFKGKVINLHLDKFRFMSKTLSHWIKRFKRNWRFRPSSIVPICKQSFYHQQKREYDYDVVHDGHHLQKEKTIRVIDDHLKVL